MSNEKNGADTQGVKAYRVNEESISDLDFACFYDLGQLLGFDPNDMTIEGDQVSGFTDGGSEYVVVFGEDEITVEIDGTDYWYDEGTSAFALAITYGIYEQI